MVKGMKRFIEGLERREKLQQARITELESKAIENERVYMEAVTTLRDEIMRLEGICREVEEHKHCKEDNVPLSHAFKFFLEYPLNTKRDHDLKIAVCKTYSEGFRCAAAIAAKWRAK